MVMSDKSTVPILLLTAKLSVNPPASETVWEEEAVLQENVIAAPDSKALTVDLLLKIFFEDFHEILKISKPSFYI